MLVVVVAEDDVCCWPREASVLDAKRPRRLLLLVAVLGCRNNNMEMRWLDSLHRNTF